MSVRTSRDNPRRHLRRHREKFFAFLIITVVFATAFGLLISETHRALASSEKPLRVWFFDIGQGDAIFIETPTGEQILIDAGPDQAVLSKLGSVMWPWDRTLDAIVITHPDADHISGFISVLERYQIDNVYDTGAIASTNVDRELRRLIDEEDTTHILVSEKDEIRFGDVVLDIVWPEKTTPGVMSKNRNDASIVIVLTYGETTLLLTGDAEEESEDKFVQNVGDIDVLKVGHHGSRSSTSEAFIGALQPDIAVIPVGLDNGYGHPHPVVIDRLSRYGAQIFRTSLDGDILLLSNGGEPMVFPSPLPF